MNIAPDVGTTFLIGPYTVRIALRPDNPACAQYVVFRGGKFVGKQFSRPCESDCRWLETHDDGLYARGSRWPETSEGRPIWNATIRRRGRPRKGETWRELYQDKVAA